jgi:predicted nucleic acid-binding protein
MNAATVVSLNTCILLRLFDVECEELLATLNPIQWVVVNAVEAEVTYLEQQRRLEALIQAGTIRREALDTEGLALFVELRGRMQDGEAAALAWAIRNGAVIASDELRSFRVEAVTRVGEARILTMPGLFLLAVRAGSLTVAEADQMKALVEANHRFKMTFRTFSDLI